MTALTARRLNGWHVLLMFVAFFGVIIATDVTFAVFAYRSAPGETAKDPYEAGLVYQQTLDQRAREAKLGWRAAVAQHGGAVEVTIADRAGAPVTGLAVRGAFVRPATERGRIEVAFREAAPGLYRLDGRAWDGAWDFEGAARAPDGRMIEIDRRLVWP